MVTFWIIQSNGENPIFVNDDFNFNPSKEILQVQGWLLKGMGKHGLTADAENRFRERFNEELRSLIFDENGG